MIQKTFIKVRTQFEGFHCYPNAGDIDPRIAFLEHKHRHMFKVEVKTAVKHTDREIEFFLQKWKLEEYLQTKDMNHMSCEMIATNLINNFLIPNYGEDRYYEVVVSEDGESDGIVEHIPN